MPERITAVGADDIVTAINAIQPGQEIVYNIDMSGGNEHLLGIVSSFDRTVVQKAVSAILLESKGMCFHKRSADGRYYEHVLYGVEPHVLHRLEDAMARVPMPSLSK